MKYLGKSFSSPANSRAFVENWDSIFGEKQDEPEQSDPVPCTVCGMWPDSGVHWNPAWADGHEYVGPASP